MSKLGWWLIGSGIVLFLLATVGGHVLQDVIGYDTTSGIAGVMGVVAGSLMVQGVIIRLEYRKTPGESRKTAGSTRQESA